MVMFWFRLALFDDKDQKFVTRHVGILGEVLFKFP